MSCVHSDKYLVIKSKFFTKEIDKPFIRAAEFEKLKFLIEIISPDKFVRKELQGNYKKLLENYKKN